MVRVSFTPNLARHVECPAAEVRGATVREVLDAVFADRPRLRGYVLDEHGALRRHMVVFVDGAAVRDRRLLGDGVRDGAEVFVMQGLSGG
jgi:sulfur-carrier protein